MQNRFFSSPPRSTQRGAFTLVELLVAVGVMLLLLAVILVPMRLGFDTFHIGKAKSEVQQAAQATVRQIEEDLHRAAYVFPNTAMPGITDATPYQGSFLNKPYVRSTDATSAINKQAVKSVCDTYLPGASAEGWENPARIDMLVRAEDANGSVVLGRPFSNYVVTYYARRRDPNPNKGFDELDNPIVLFRAQFPYRNGDETPFAVSTPAGAYNADTSDARYPTSSCPLALGSQLNRNALWLGHNYFGEANLEPLCVDSTVSGLVIGSHTLATPRGMALVAANARKSLLAPPAPDTDANALVPDTSFICESGERNGKTYINRVTINLALAQYDAANAATFNGIHTAQRARYSQVVDLPNLVEIAP